jgi:hypothetical protein
MLWRRCVQLGTGAVLLASSLACATAAAAAPGPARPGTAGLVRLIRPGVQVGPATPGSARPAAARPLTNATSTNWSGYAASGGPFTKVSASWVEPTGTCSSGNQYASFWVGLDGYSSSTVEQTGSEVDCSGGRARYYSWYEMYPAYPVNFSNTVRPGDHFTGSVAYNGGGSYTLTLTDATQGWSHIVSATLNGAANSSAEVIAEAPSSTGGVLPLTDFGTVNFSGATVNGSPIGNASPAQITMVDSAGRDKDVVSALSGGQNFSATWQRST